MVDGIGDPSLTTTLLVTDDEAQLAVLGELDADSARKMRSALDDALKLHSVVVIDMAGVDFIDSAGLATLIHAYKQAAARGGSLHVTRPSRQVTRLLGVTGQAERFIA